MILATDVQYHPDGSATAAAVGVAGWADKTPALTHTVQIAQVAPYVPGQFFERELPCLMALLDGLDPRVVIVDGHVTLGPDARPGLGAHLFKALGGAIPVIGVAKTPFRGTPSGTEVWRGRSKHPLFVTAAGIDPTQARAQVAALHGPYRIPTLLAAADRLARAG